MLSPLEAHSDIFALLLIIIFALHAHFEQSYDDFHIDLFRSDDERTIVVVQIKNI